MKLLRTLFVASSVLALSAATLSAQDAQVTCKDGAKSKAGRGACSGHGGVAAAAAAKADAKIEKTAATAQKKIDKTAATADKKIEKTADKAEAKTAETKVAKKHHTKAKAKA